MEEVPWILFSFLAVLTAIGAITLLLQTHSDDARLETTLLNLQKLGNQCDFVCNAAPGTSLPAEVILTGGDVLYTGPMKICIAFPGGVRCAPCPCTVKDYTLDLNTSFAWDAISDQAYACYMTNTKNGLQIECQG